MIKEVRMKNINLLFIGCGNMGGAMLKGWMASSLKSSLTRVDVVKPSPPKDDLKLDSVEFHTSLDAIKHTPDVVVWGVKPYHLSKVVSETIAALGDKPIYISIGAGKDVAALDGFAGQSVKIVRSMPNTPVELGQGITGLCANAKVSAEDKQQLTELFNALGQAAWIEEEQMNALTALCGSGPAYVYYFMECLSGAATQLGLDKDQADRLARQMVLGAASLANQSEKPLATLREEVTSPNGTTAAALNVWMHPRTLDSQALAALKAAVNRAEELLKEG